jgi:hypothetical protein
MESNLRYDNAFDTVLSHTPAMEIAEFWRLFGEADGGDQERFTMTNRLCMFAEIDLGEGTRLSLSDDAPATPFEHSNPMNNPMHKQLQGDVDVDSMVGSPATGNIDGDTVL